MLLNDKNYKQWHIVCFVWKWIRTLEMTVVPRKRTNLLPEIDQVHVNYVASVCCCFLLRFFPVCVWRAMRSAVLNICLIVNENADVDLKSWTDEIDRFDWISVADCSNSNKHEHSDAKVIFAVVRISNMLFCIPSEIDNMINKLVMIFFSCPLRPTGTCTFWMRKRSLDFPSLSAHVKQKHSTTVSNWTTTTKSTVWMLANRFTWTLMVPTPKQIVEGFPVQR